MATGAGLGVAVGAGFGVGAAVDDEDDEDDELDGLGVAVACACDGWVDGVGAVAGTVGLAATPLVAALMVGCQLAGR